MMELCKQAGAECLYLGIQVSSTQEQIKVQLNWKYVSSSHFRPIMDNHWEAEWFLKKGSSVTEPEGI